MCKGQRNDHKKKNKSSRLLQSFHQKGHAEADEKKWEPCIGVFMFGTGEAAADIAELFMQTEGKL